jgi:hypothetical protein
MHLLAEARRKREQAVQARRISFYVSLDGDRACMIHFADEMEAQAVALEKQALLLSPPPSPNFV